MKTVGFGTLVYGEWDVQCMYGHKLVQASSKAKGAPRWTHKRATVKAKRVKRRVPLT